METSMMRFMVSGEKAVYGTYKEVLIDKLKLSPRNPRLGHLKDRGPLTDKQMEKIIWEENDTKLLYKSIVASKGISEPLFIKGDGSVLEGNRRLVCLRHAKKSAKKGDIPGTTEKTFNKVQAIELPDDISDLDLDFLLARWHVTGRKVWAAINQAEHIYKLNHTHGESFARIGEILAKSKGYVYQKYTAYKWTVEFIEKYPKKSKILDFSFFEELFKKSELRKKFDDDARFKKEFHEWILTGKFNDTGAKDIRDLPKIVVSDTAYQTFKKKGMLAAKLVLAEESPEYGNRVFRSVKGALENLRKIDRATYMEIPSHKNQISLLKELRNEIGKVLKELEIE